MRTAIALCTIMLALTGCDRTPNAPASPPQASPSDIDALIEAVQAANPGSEVVVEYDNWDRSSGGSLTSEHAGESLGSGLRTSSDEAAQHFSSSAPSLKLPGGLELTGHGVDIQNELFSASINPFFLLGGLLLVAAVVFAYLKRKNAAIWAGIGSAACIAVAVTVDTVPMLWVWMLLLAVLGGAFWLWSEWKRGQAERHSSELGRSLRVVTKAVDASPAAAAEEVKSRVKAAAEADPVIKERIKQAKQ